MRQHVRQRGVFGFVFMAVLAIGVFLPSFAYADKHLLIASRDQTLTNRFAEQVLKKAYGELGIDVQFSLFPGSRSVVEANAGRADGEAARLESIIEHYPNLIKVPVPLFYSELSVFVRKNHVIEIAGWESLAGRSVTTINGFKYVRQKLAEERLRVMDTSAESIQLIEDDLVEAAVLNKFLGLLAVAEIKAEKVMVLSPPLERQPVYHFLHQKHADVAEQLTEVLASMERNGVLAAMWTDFADESVRNAIKAAGR